MGGQMHVRTFSCGGVDQLRAEAVVTVDGAAEIIKAAIEELHRAELMDDDTQHALLSLRGLAEEKSLYVDMFNRGHLSERAFRQQLLALQQQLDAVCGRGAYQDVQPACVAQHRLEEAVLRVVNKVTALAPLAARLHWQRIILDYAVARARLQSSRRVLDVLDTLARVEATPRYIVDMLRCQYQRTYETVQHALDQIAEQFPDLINDMQERLARRLLLVAEAEAIA
jgi:CPA1 family monovalent cation:H+ antiporter